MIPEGINMVPKGIQMVPGGINMVPRVIKMVPECIKMVPERIEMVPEGIKIVPDKATRILSIPLRSGSADRIHSMPSTELLPHRTRSVPLTRYII